MPTWRRDEAEPLVEPSRRVALRVRGELDPDRAPPTGQVQDVPHQPLAEPPAPQVRPHADRLDDAHLAADVRQPAHPGDLGGGDDLTVELADEQLLVGVGGDLVEGGAVGRDGYVVLVHLADHVLALQGDDRGEVRGDGLPDAPASLTRRHAASRLLSALVGVGDGEDAAERERGAVRAGRVRLAEQRLVLRHEHRRAGRRAAPAASAGRRCR